MSKQIEALKLALEAMEDMLSGDLTPYQASKTITSIKKALAEQPAQQPCEAPCGDIKCAVMCKRHEQPVQQESEAVRAAWMAGYTEGEREAIEKEQPANVAAVNTSSERVDKTEENVHEKNI